MADISKVTLNGTELDVKDATARDTLNALGGTDDLSTATVGDSTTPVYLSEGVLTASDETVGGTRQPVYMNGGTVTALPWPTLLSCGAYSGSTSISKFYIYMPHSGAGNATMLLAGSTFFAVLLYYPSNVSSSSSSCSVYNLASMGNNISSATVELDSTYSTSGAKITVNLTSSSTYTKICVIPLTVKDSINYLIPTAVTTS